MEESGCRIQPAQYFKYYQFEHDAWERKCGREGEDDDIVVDFIVLEQYSHEEYPSANKKQKLEKKKTIHSNSDDSAYRFIPIPNGILPLIGIWWSSQPKRTWQRLNTNEKNRTCKFACFPTCWYFLFFLKGFGAKYSNDWLDSYGRNAYVHYLIYILESYARILLHITCKK